MKLCVIVLMCLLVRPVSGQDQTIDSLLQITNSSKPDTTKVRAYLYIAQLTVGTDIDTTIYFVKKAEKLAEAHNFKPGLGEVYGWLGYLYNAINQPMLASEYNLKSIPILNELGQEQTVSIVYSNIGMNYHHMGDIKNAIINYQHSLDISTRLKDT